MGPIEQSSIILSNHYSSIINSKDAPMAEVYALKECLMFAKYIGFNLVIIQFKCMEVV
jgi:hypothetical protein